MAKTPGNGNSVSTFIGTTEAAERLDISARRLRAMIAAGLIPAVKVGRTWVIDERCIHDYKKRHAGRPPLIRKYD
jgi:excisionase family DNA binding protein